MGTEHGANSSTCAEGRIERPIDVVSGYCKVIAERGGDKTLGSDLSVRLDRQSTHTSVQVCSDLTPDAETLVELTIGFVADKCKVFSGIDACSSRDQYLSIWLDC